MSHVAKIKLEIKDLAALKAAAARLGLEFVEGQQTYRWYGRHVGDYPLPAGFTKEDLGRCEHAIRVPNHPEAYEVGIVKSKDGRGYTMLWDFFMGGYGLEAAIGKNAGRLCQEYSATVAERYYKANGYRTARTVKDGKVILKAFK